MARNKTNKHYALRKLKKGTASVAVALSVLGAGLVANQTVKADEESKMALQQEMGRSEELVNRAESFSSEVANIVLLAEQLKGTTEVGNDLISALENRSSVFWEPHIQSFRRNNNRVENLLDYITGDDARRVLTKELVENGELKEKVAELLKQSEKLAADLKEKQADYQLAIDSHAFSEKEHQQFIDGIAKVLEDREQERHELEMKLKQSQDELATKIKELDVSEEKLADEKLAKEGIVEGLTVYVTDKEAEVADLIKQLEAKSAEIQEKEAEKARQENMYEAFMSQYKETVEKQEQELAKLKQLETINNNLLGNAKDVIAKLSDENERLANEKSKLTEEKQILEASRKRTNRDLATVREAKKATEAELADTNAKLEKLQEEKQILEASRKRTNRDLAATREAKQQVDAELAKLKAEAEALKEQLAKQAEEIEKLKKAKEEAPEAPKAPEKPEVPGKTSMPWTALTPAKPIAKDDKQADGKPSAKTNMMSTDVKKDEKKLPSTGETVNPFFTAAALTVLASAGVAAVAKRKEEN